MPRGVARPSAAVRKVRRKKGSCKSTRPNIWKKNQHLPYINKIIEDAEKEVSDESSRSKIENALEKAPLTRSQMNNETQCAHVDEKKRKKHEKKMKNRQSAKTSKRKDARQLEMLFDYTEEITGHWRIESVRNAELTDENNKLRIEIQSVKDMQLGDGSPSLTERENCFNVNEHGHEFIAMYSNSTERESPAYGPSPYDPDTDCFLNEKGANEVEESPTAVLNAGIVLSSPAMDLPQGKSIHVMPEMVSHQS